jgi:DNA-binding response OmpR family regulator
LMPGLDGIATLQKLKADGRTARIPVIMVTVLDRDAKVSQCLNEGAIDHIAKPFSNLVVRARVRTVLQNRRVMRRWIFQGQHISRAGISLD